eukprot:4896397-Amphidinium_carterae.1
MVAVAIQTPTNNTKEERTKWSLHESGYFCQRETVWGPRCRWERCVVPVFLVWRKDDRLESCLSSRSWAHRVRNTSGGFLNESGWMIQS